MTAPAHLLVFRPIIERLRARGHDVRSRRATTRRRCSCSSGTASSHGVRPPRRRLARAQAARAAVARTARDAALRGAARLRPRRRARLQRPGARRGLAAHPGGQHVRLRVRRPAAPHRLPAGPARDGPGRDPAGAAAARTAPGRASWCSTRGSRRSTTSPTSSRTCGIMDAAGVDPRRVIVVRPPAAGRVALSPQVEHAVPAGARRTSARRDGVHAVVMPAHGAAARVRPRARAARR